MWKLAVVFTDWSFLLSLNACVKLLLSAIPYSALSLTAANPLSPITNFELYMKDLGNQFPHLCNDTEALICLKSMEMFDARGGRNQRPSR